MHVCKYTMVGFGFKNEQAACHGGFIYSTLSIPTNILALAKCSGCVGAIYITVKLKKIIAAQGDLFIQVVSNIGCTVLGHTQCVLKWLC